jgi:hypothetical protein
MDRGGTFPILSKQVIIISHHSSLALYHPTSGNVISKQRFQEVKGITISFYNSLSSPIMNIRQNLIPHCGATKEYGDNVDCSHRVDHFELPVEI